MNAFIQKPKPVPETTRRMELIAALLVVIALTALIWPPVGPSLAYEMRSMRNTKYSDMPYYLTRVFLFNDGLRRVERADVTETITVRYTDPGEAFYARIDAVSDPDGNAATSWARSQNEADITFDYLRPTDAAELLLFDMEPMEFTVQGQVGERPLQAKKRVEPFFLIPFAVFTGVLFLFLLCALALLLIRAKKPDFLRRKEDEFEEPRKRTRAGLWVRSHWPVAYTGIWLIIYLVLWLG